ncbi:hypothetical protein [Natranaerobius thermophilus]|uniref:Uncharacterized protein n=1 Tax=Natranaerobius thermophilus (strain ATCC BAA-1301 / DSM 18059 / JW/NM-WN-LF) TaxID=457570 RepID=B2A5R9_NATTJ|nr:hypothetical protein [Natranaerobius thermophilus]ACB84012.1 hypothetical protein Nther_0416 [Natranaerobius thermophilus JW/NM-WN-LF]
MNESKGTILFLALLVLVLIMAGMVVFSGFFEDEPEEREHIKVDPHRIAVTVKTYKLFG